MELFKLILTFLILLLFSLIGLALLWRGGRDMLTRLLAWSRLQVVQGVITAVESEVESYYTSKKRRKGSRGSDTFYYPVILFQTQTGESVTFTSEVGEMKSSRPYRWSFGFNRRRNDDELEYVVGRTIAVCYDPTGAIPPCIDSWVAMFHTPIILLIVGLITCGFMTLIFYLDQGKLISDIIRLLDWSAT